MITKIVSPEPIPAHPGSAGCNQNICPQCETRCGALIHGHCLGCEVGWDKPSPTAKPVKSSLTPRQHSVARFRLDIERDLALFKADPSPANFAAIEQTMLAYQQQIKG